jgi:flavodoxin
MKNLIVYYSFTNNNEKLADYLRKKLNCDAVKIETVKKRSGFSILLDLVFKRRPELKTIPYYLRDYDHVIFIAPVWAGKIAMPMTSYMTNEKRNIKSYSFITLCGGGNPNQKDKIRNELGSLLGKEPSNVLELWVNDLLTPEKKNSVKYTSGFRIGPEGVGQFENKLRDFIKEENLVSAI